MCCAFRSREFCVWARFGHFGVSGFNVWHCLGPIFQLTCSSQQWAPRCSPWICAMRLAWVLLSRRLHRFHMPWAPNATRQVAVNYGKASRGIDGRDWCPNKRTDMGFRLVLVVEYHHVMHVVERKQVFLFSASRLAARIGHRPCPCILLLVSRQCLGSGAHVLCARYAWSPVSHSGFGSLTNTGRPDPRCSARRLLHLRSRAAPCCRHVEILRSEGVEGLFVTRLVTFLSGNYVFEPTP